MKIKLRDIFNKSDIDYIKDMMLYRQNIVDCDYDNVILELLKSNVDKDYPYTLYLKRDNNLLYLDDVTDDFATRISCEDCCDVITLKVDDYIQVFVQKYNYDNFCVEFQFRSNRDEFFGGYCLTKQFDSADSFYEFLFEIINDEMLFGIDYLIKQYENDFN